MADEQKCCLKPNLGSSWNPFFLQELAKGSFCVKSSVTQAGLTILLRRLIRFRQDKGQIVHVLEIDHNGQVTGGLNTNGAPTGCLLNGPLTLMAFNSIRIKVDVDPNENTLPFSSSQRQGLVKILSLINNQLILVHLGGGAAKE